MKVYYLIAIGHDGMYTRGNLSVSPTLAKLNPGNLIRQCHGRKMRTLGVIEEDADGQGQRVLIEAEKHPGQWTIGPPDRQDQAEGLANEPAEEEVS